MGILHRNIVGRTYVRELPTVTVDQFWKWGPCWAASDVFRILKRYKRKHWTALEVLALDEVEPGDRLWVVMREPMLPVDVLVRIARETAAVAMNLSGWSDDRSWLALEPSPTKAAAAAARSASATHTETASAAHASASNAAYDAACAAAYAYDAACAAAYAYDAACAAAHAYDAAYAATVCGAATQTVLRYIAGCDMGGPLWTKRTAL